MTFVVVVFLFCGGTYRKWKPIDAHQRTSRVGGGEFRSKPDSVLGEYSLSGNPGNLESNSGVYWREKLHEHCRFRKVFFLHEVKLIYSLFQS